MTYVGIQYDFRHAWQRRQHVGLPKQEGEVQRIDALQQKLLRFTLLNFFIVASIGVLLRAVPVFGPFNFDYSNMLHGHSHFAFGGWVTPLLLWMIMYSFPDLKYEIRFVHWRNLVLVFLTSAYGMLLTFPLQGYAPASILFSTLSMAGTFYLAFLLWKKLRSHRNTSSQFLKAAAFFLVISAIGPLATGPIVSSGMSGTPLYFNAIYYYLHFQYNGWFMFVIFAVLYRRLEEKGLSRTGSFVYATIFIGCLLTLPLSFLWSKSPQLFNLIGATGALVQGAGVIFFLKDQLSLKEPDSFLRRIHVVVFSVLVLKCTLQLLSAVPFMTGFVYSNRVLIVAYLHMVLLGFVSLFGLSLIYRYYQNIERMKIPVYGFLLGFFTTEIIMVINASATLTGFYMPHTNSVLLGFSFLFPLSAVYMLHIHPDMKSSKVFKPADS